MTAKHRRITGLSLAELMAVRHAVDDAAARLAERAPAVGHLHVLARISARVDAEVRARCTPDEVTP